MKRAAAVVVVIVVVFAVVLARTFPTATLVARALDAAPLPDGMRLEFARAGLGIGGLRLDGVVLRQASGAPIVQADWVRLRPSLWGLVRGRRGSPWRVGLGVFQGEIESAIAVEGAQATLDTEWHDVELGAVVPLVARRTDVVGRLAGTARVVLRGRTPVSGSGRLDLRAGRWTLSRQLFDGAVAHADTAGFRWTLGSRRLTIEDATVAGPDFDATASGTVRFATVVAASLLDFRVDVTPKPALHPRVAQVLDGVAATPPGARGPRRLAVTGTLGAPRVRAP